MNHMSMRITARVLVYASAFNHTGDAEHDEH